MTNVKKLKKILAPIFKKNDVVRSSVFGSFARGESTRKSDIDILVEFGKQKSLLDLVRLQREIKEILHRDVDLLTYKSIHPRLKKYILRDEVKIYG